MILQVFTIKDSKTGIFNSPFFNHTPGEAERNFRELANDPQSMIGKYPEDYDLYALGKYDDQTGKVAWEETPQHLVKATQLVKSKQ